MIEFLPVLMAAIALFLLTAAVLPDEVPRDGLDLKAWYLRNTRQIWILASVALSLVIAISARDGFDSVKAVLDFAKSEWDNWILLAMFVWLVFTKRLRVHEVGVVLAMIDMVYSASGFRIG